ncbi:MAG: hypothetical protein K0V04_23460, partial [Deltaproteobacteria bacterium]|nr:hypothetical protein [Deltaproteobacteria bacterium]
ARSQGAVTLRGRFFSYEGDQPPPYETFLWMLSAHSSEVSARGKSGSRSGAHGIEDLGQDKWRAFSKLTQGFAERTQGRALVITVDDLQWSTGLDLEFLAYLPRALDTPVMLVGTALTTGANEAQELSAWLGRLGHQRSLNTIRLSGFAIGEVRAWFQACFPGIRIRPQDVRRLEHATSGNPYYLAEVVGQLVQTRRIQRNAQGYSCAPLDEVALPQTVHSVVAAKLAGLDEDLRGVLQTACVVGEEFRFELLQQAMGADEDELEAQLERATKRNLLSEQCRSPGSDFRFDTTTLRSVLYDGLSRRRRRRLHRKVVDALLAIHGEDGADRIARVLCYHYHAIEDHEGTLRWGLRAAVDTLARYDHDHAELSLRRALHASEALSAQGHTVPRASAVELDRLTGLLYVRIGRLEDADVVLQRALEATELEDGAPETSSAQRLDIMLLLSGCQLGRGLLEVAVELGEMAIELAEELSDRPREFDARLRTARAAAARGQLDNAAVLLEPILDAGDPTLAPITSMAMAELASVYATQGAFDRAYTLAQDARQLAQTADDQKAVYRAISALALLHLEGGDLAAAIQHLEAALEMARSLSLRRREGIELHNLASCRYFMNAHEEAEARAREALAIFLEIKDLASEGDARVNLGRILRAQGSQDDALKVLDAGRELCATMGRGAWEGVALLELGLGQTLRGDLTAAAESLERASELFGAMDSSHLWRSELALATLALAEGDRPRGATHAKRAAQLVDLLRARLGHGLDHEAFDRSVAEVRDVLDAVLR